MCCYGLLTEVLSSDVLDTDCLVSLQSLQVEHHLNFSGTNVVIQQVSARGLL